MSYFFRGGDGLYNAINPLASLIVPYGIPVLMIVSWRGEPGRKDEPHHHPMGAATPELLELFDIPVTILGDDANLVRTLPKLKGRIRPNASSGRMDPQLSSRGTRSASSR